MQVLSQRSGCSDGLSIARADFIGSLVPQQRSHSREDPRPVNHPVAIDDGDTAFGLQSWRKTPCSSITLVFVHYENISTVRRYICVCVCVCVSVYPGSFGSLLSPVCWCCVLLQESLQSYGSRREGKSERNSPSPPESRASTHIQHTFLHTKPQVLTVHVPTRVHLRCALCMLAVPGFHHHGHVFQQHNHKFPCITLLLFFSHFHSSILLSNSLPLSCWKFCSSLSPVQQLVWVGEPFWSLPPLLLYFYFTNWEFNSSVLFMPCLF